MQSKAAILLLAIYVSGASGSSSTTTHATPRVAVAVAGCPAAVLTELLRAFRGQGLTATQVTDEEFASLSNESYDVLVLPHAPSLPAAAAPAYFAFAKGGGHLVLLGGRPPRLNITAVSYTHLTLPTICSV